VGVGVERLGVCAVRWCFKLGVQHAMVCKRWQAERSANYVADSPIDLSDVDLLDVIVAADLTQQAAVTAAHH
jgi:hypothetical protein